MNFELAGRLSLLRRHVIAGRGTAELSRPAHLPHCERARQIFGGTSGASTLNGAETIETFDEIILKHAALNLKVSRWIEPSITRPPGQEWQLSYHQRSMFYVNKEKSLRVCRAGCGGAHGGHLFG
jgi:hypothetical protein